MTIEEVLELIDTCWNVNQLITIDNIAGYIELIDTCWNVNAPIASATL